MSRSEYDNLYDLRLYKTHPAEEELTAITAKLEEFHEQFVYFRSKMLPDIYLHLSDLQKRFNGLANCIRDLNARFNEKHYPGD